MDYCNLSQDSMGRERIKVSSRLESISGMICNMSSVKVLNERICANIVANVLGFQSETVPILIRFWRFRRYWLFLNANNQIKDLGMWGMTC
jgi:hypothetical protein